MQGSQTWRELLGKILQDPRERARIAAELGVNPLTLTRWINGESSPRAQNLRALLRALPQYRKLFLELIPKEFGHIIIPGEALATAAQHTYLERANLSRSTRGEFSCIHGLVTCMVVTKN